MQAANQQRAAAHSEYPMVVDDDHHDECLMEHYKHDECGVGTVDSDQKCSPMVQKVPVTINK